MPVLVKFKADWGDEFDCERFRITKDVTIERASEMVDDLIAEGGYFGSNEGFEPEELSRKNFEVIEISEEEADTIIRYLGSDFGTGLIV